MITFQELVQKYLKEAKKELKETENVLWYYIGRIDYYQPYKEAVHYERCLVEELDRCIELCGDIEALKSFRAIDSRTFTMAKGIPWT